MRNSADYWLHLHGLRLENDCGELESHVDGVYKDLTVTIKEEDLDKPLKIVMEYDEEALEELQKRQNWGY